MSLTNEVKEFAAKELDIDYTGIASVDRLSGAPVPILTGWIVWSLPVAAGPESRPKPTLLSPSFPSKTSPNLT